MTPRVVLKGRGYYSASNDMTKAIVRSLRDATQMALAPPIR